MQRIDGIDLVPMEDEWAVVWDTNSQAAQKKSILLNRVAAIVLDALKQESSLEQLADLLQSQYHVSREEVLQDLTTLLNTFTKLGLLQTK